jgi:hypothetical protein
LRTTKNLPPAERLEALEMAVKTNYGLYQQEKDREGMAIYAPLLPLVQQAKGVEELEALANKTTRETPSRSRLTSLS